MFKRLILASLLLCAPVFGQQPEVIKTQLVTVALNIKETTLFYRTGEEVKEFTAGMNGLGEPFLYVGPRRFILHTSKAAFEPVKEGEKPPVPAAFVDLPERSARVLLVCVPMPDKSLRLIAYDIAKNSMKDGDYKVFNFSKSNLSMILGEKSFVVPTSKDVQVSDNSWQAGVLDLQCKIGIIQPDNKSVNPAYSSVWGHRPIRRNMVFIFDGVRSDKTVQVRRFYDIILPDQPQAAAQ
jgi:hypothetical protein